MMIRHCANCGREFKTQWHEKYYCCRDCKRQARRKREREHRNAALAVNREFTRQGVLS